MRSWTVFDQKERSASPTAYRNQKPLAEAIKFRSQSSDWLGRATSPFADLPERLWKT
jgi:hypothetical protein